MSERVRLTRCLCLAGVFLLAAHALSFGQQATLPKSSEEIDVPALLRESKERSDRNWELMLRRYADYSLKRRRTLRETNAKGEVKEESQLYEIFIPTNCKERIRCNAVLILLEKDGKPVSPDKIEKARLEAGKRLEKNERETENQNTQQAGGPSWMRFSVNFHHPGGDQRVMLDGQEILEKCEFSSPQREMIRGREAIALSFRPHFGAVFSGDTFYMNEVEGKIWIDTQDKVIIRLAAWPAGTKFDDESSESLLKNAALAYDLVRTREGIWFFRLGRINANKYSSLFYDEKVDFSVEQFDYVAFRVEVEDGQVQAPK
ncbi:MAG TPA: hypothetical protein VF779_04270 [Pyrinomonadaceae bacterium]